MEVELALTPKIRAEEERFGERVASAAVHGEVLPPLICKGSATSSGRPACRGASRSLATSLSLLLSLFLARSLKHGGVLAPPRAFVVLLLLPLGPYSRPMPGAL